MNELEPPETINSRRICVSATIESVVRRSEVGALIIERGGLVVTGGYPSADSSLPVRPVKAAAMDGARKAAAQLILASGSDKPSPMYGIAVLPKRDSVDVKFHPEVCALPTGMGSYERNVLNAALADAMIALHGGPGTICEIAFAVFFGKPVFFICGPEEVTEINENLGAMPTWFDDKVKEGEWRTCVQNGSRWFRLDPVVVEKRFIEWIRVDST